MEIQDFDPVETFGGLVGLMMIALKDRKLPPLEERWSQIDIIHGFHFRRGKISGTFWIRASELKRFGFGSPQDLDAALTDVEGFTAFTGAVELVGGRFFRAYELDLTND